MGASGRAEDIHQRKGFAGEYLQIGDGVGDRQCIKQTLFPIQGSLPTFRSPHSHTLVHKKGLPDCCLGSPADYFPEPHISIAVLPPNRGKVVPFVWNVPQVCSLWRFPPRQAKIGVVLTHLSLYRRCASRPSILSSNSHEDTK